jgi:eukaryotic-like serine/threonine-protein kinase
MNASSQHPTTDVPLALSAALAERYRVERLLGRGGMATVYLARDLRHDRDVAVKVLQPEVSASIGGERFLGEIRTTGQLKHPHILPLFDSGSSGAVLFYVMPFIDGESLRARIERTGRLGVDDIIRILQQLADALAYAHSHGVIHRDIKPENVLVSGRHIFLADFGIARALETPDAATKMTGTGVMVGTPVYMAPEQAVGDSVDHRADIYAFGVLAYELLSGSPPFKGSSQQILTARLTESPRDVTRRRPDTPPALGALVMKCIEKDRDARCQGMDDVLAALEGLAQSEARTPATRPRASVSRGAVLAVASLAIVAAIGVWYTLNGPTTSGALAIGRIFRVTSEPGLELDPALAPDGRTIAYVAGAPGQMRVYLRQLAEGRVVPLVDDRFTDAQRWPQWAPDGSRLIFQAGLQQLLSRSAPGTGMLYQVPALGGTPRKLFTSVEQGRAISPTWSPQGDRIVFGGAEGLYLAASDGETTPQRLVAESDAHSPRWSPDGSKIAYVNGGSGFTFADDNLGNTSTSVLMMLTLADGRSHRITSGNWLETNPVWMPDSRTLLFISSRDGGRDVYVLRLAPDGQPEGEPARLTSGLNAHSISISVDGTLLAYASYTPSANVWSVPIPEAGTVTMADARQVTFGNEKIEKLAVSPDGQWLAYDSDRNGQADIWKVPIAGGTPELLTRGPNHEFVNDWSPDGRQLVFHSMREGGQRDVFVVSADGTGVQPVATSPAEEQHAAWGPDSNTILFDSAERGAANQVYVVTRAGRGAPWSAPRQITRNGSSDPKWSPNGRLIAYSVRGEIRVIAPDGTSDRRLVDGQPGNLELNYPLWSPDSGTIYYRAYDRDRRSSIWAVPVTGGPPQLLVRFDDPARRSLRREFATDGHRFYFTIAREESDISAMELLRK